jgi:hypothetical protein
MLKKNTQTLYVVVVAQPPILSCWFWGTCKWIQMAGRGVWWSIFSSNAEFSLDNSWTDEFSLKLDR